MKSFIAFFRKEMLENVRHGKMIIVLAIFILFGIMNPAITKFTPIIMDYFAESMEGSGLVITDIAVDALASFTQFFKNIPMALIAFVLIYSNTFTKEYSSGTLILILSKGLDRYKVILAKAVSMIIVYSLGYWLCFGITYLANSLLWDNSIVKNLVFTVTNQWIFGLLIISLIIFFSTVFKNYIFVLLGTGGTVLTFYMIGIVPKIAKVMPTYIMNSTGLIMGAESPDEYAVSLIITVVLTVALIGASIPILNKKQL